MGSFIHPVSNPCSYSMKQMYHSRGTFENSREHLWTQGNSREPMRTQGNTWELKGTLGNSRELMGTHGNIREHLRTQVNTLELKGNIWEIKGTLETKGEHCTIWQKWNHSIPSKEHIGTQGNSRGTFGNSREHMKLKGNIWELKGTLETQGEHLGTQGNTWEHLKKRVRLLLHSESGKTSPTFTT